jgi:hypothetical protein
MRICKDLYTQQRRDYSVEIEDLVAVIVPGYRIPADSGEALHLFVRITTELDRLEL